MSYSHESACWNGPDVPAIEDGEVIVALRDSDCYHKGEPPDDRPLYDHYRGERGREGIYWISDEIHRVMGGAPYRIIWAADQAAWYIVTRDTSAALLLKLTHG